MIVAEWSGFFPECFKPLISDHHKAVWLVPSEIFKRNSVARRDKLGGVPVSDHEQAVQNLISRDLLMGEYVRQRACELELKVFEIDGTKGLDEVASLVESHFAPWLPASV